MDRDRQSELMSAYLDGELTPDERTEAERLLEGAPELRDELNDFARLSDLLRALPREAAPAELAAAIRREAERKSLLGADPAVPRRSLLRETVVVLTAVAATVLTMLLLPDESPRRNSQVAVNETAHDADSFASDQPFSARKELPAEGMLRGTDGIAAAPPPALAKAEMTASSAAMRATPAAPPPSAVFHDADVAENLNNMLSLNGTEPALDAVRLGDVLTWRLDGNGVGVIELTVVDIDAAGDRLAVLLENNGLDVLPEGTATQAKERATEKKPAGKPSNQSGDPGREQQLMLVYVDASRETISQVLEEMVQEQLFSRAKLQPPVEAPEIAEVVAAPAEDSPAVAGDKDKTATDESQAAKVLVSEAVVAGQNYSRARNQLSEQQMPRDGLSRGMAGKDNRNAADRQNWAIQKHPQRMRYRAESNSISEDAPADAGVAQNTLAPAVRRQNAAAVLQYDPVSGEVQNSTVAIEQRKDAQVKQEAKRTVAAEKAKAAGEPKKFDQLRELEELTNESPGEPTIRLLFVLQTPAAAAAPAP